MPTSSPEPMFGVVVTSPKGARQWIEGPMRESEAQEMAQLLKAFGCDTLILSMNYTELPIGENDG